MEDAIVVPTTTPDAEATVRAEPAAPLVKGKGGKAADGTQALTTALNSKISELEGQATCSVVEREGNKVRKKSLREVMKFVSDRSNTLEEKMTFLADKYEKQVRHDDMMRLSADFEHMCYHGNRDLFHKTILIHRTTLYRTFLYLSVSCT